MGVSNTRTDLTPVTPTCHALLQPTWIILKIVLLVSPVHDGPAGPFIGHSISKDDEPNKGRYDDEHSPQVEVHKEGVPVARAGEAREWHDHDGDPNHYERPLEEFQAVGVVGTAAQPYSAAQDGDGEEEGEEVEETY